MCVFFVSCWRAEHCVPRAGTASDAPEFDSGGKGSMAGPHVGFLT